MEGGSTSAVLTYLCRILESIEQADLVYSILHFLLASPSDSDSAIPTGASISVSRRKSLDALTAFAEEAAQPSPSLFNLRDLALLGLQSPNEQTILATLRLLTVILQRHPSFADLLIRTIPGRPAKQRTVGALNAEIQQLLSIATSVVGDPTLDDSYDNYLKDATLTVESRFCVHSPAEGDLTADDAVDRPLELREDDPIMRQLLGCLETFFTNSVIINLALTEILISIASSHLISLDGWLLVDPSKYDYKSSVGSFPPEATTLNEETPVADVLAKIRTAYREPTWSSSDTPVLSAVLQKLVQQIQQWRRDMPDFDVLVAARRDLLHQEDEVPSTPGLLRQPTEPPTAMTAAPVHVRQESRPATPRGRGPGPVPRDLSSEASPSPQRPTTAIGSPLWGSPGRPPPSRGSSVSRAAAAEELRKRLAMPFDVDVDRATVAKNTESTTSEANPTSPVEDSEQQAAVDDATVCKPATFGHVLTNVVILYEFLLEITAVVQVRGNLFEEAGY